MGVMANLLLLRIVLNQYTPKINNELLKMNFVSRESEMGREERVIF